MAYKQKPKPPDKFCKQCGQLFTPSKNDCRIVFCSPECYLTYRKESGYMENYYHANLKKWHDMNNSRDHRDIENYGCDPALCEECDGIKVWDEPKGSNTRVHLLFEEERYMVILERRKEYVLLITAYYFDYNNTLEKQLKQYRRYAPKRQDAP